MLIIADIYGQLCWHIHLMDCNCCYKQMVIAWDLKYTVIALLTLNFCDIKTVIAASFSSIGLKYVGKGNFAMKTKRNRRML